MNDRRLHPVLRLSVSGLLSVLWIWLYPAVRHDPRWLIGVAGVAALAFVLLSPVMVRGRSGEKMLAGILLFLPSFGLVVAVTGVLESL
jgi:hypothetical protein